MQNRVSTSLGLSLCETQFPCFRMYPAAFKLTVYCGNDCKYQGLTLEITDREQKIKSVLKEISLILENTSDITLSNDIQDFKAAIDKMNKVTLG